MQRVFVVGCSRSGTTLLQSLLSAHARVYSLPETAFFQRLVGDSENRLFSSAAEASPFGKALTRKIRTALRISAQDLNATVLGICAVEGSNACDLNLLSGRMTYGNATRKYLSLLDRLAKEKDCIAWVEKTPSHVHFLKEIARYCPGASVVHIIRDGKDVCASLRAAAQKYPNAHWPKMYTTVERIVARWNKALTDSMEWRSAPGHLFVQYESLVANPLPVLEILCTRTSLPFEESTLSARENATNRIVGKDEPWKSGVSKPIQSASRSQFRDVFDRAEREYVERNLLDVRDFQVDFIVP